jgi:ech hydrogenase subunit A
MNVNVFMLITVPVIFAILFLLNDNKNYYKILSYILCGFGIIASIVLAIQGPTSIIISGSLFGISEGIVVICEVLIIFYLFYVSIKHKRWHVLALTVIQTLLFIYSTFFMQKAETGALSIDYLSIIMALIVNIIGTLIVVFANGYMTKYEHHRNMKSRQKIFYVVICIFLAAMNGMIFSDSLSWMYFFWEITTLASFLLISYNQDAEGFDSGFRALFLNIIGGISFSIGIILFQNMMGINTLSGIIKNGKVGTIYIIPVFLLCIAGFAKSAQMPFQSWLLGAMVAPTPVSALLHSSTMVKAGVFLIIKLSPAFAGTPLGTAIAIYGAFTFFICSAIAVSQRNAKRVLAYSTIANLGLIISSAGIGTNTAIAAAIILLVFHAISKALLFLCTGQIEHTIGSRDIEDMVGLVHIAPGLALITAFGLVSMILPPFGVLITKLISIEASANNPFVLILLVLGSALTTLYYVKWMGSILSYPESKLTRNGGADKNIYVPLCILSILVLLTSIFISPLYSKLVSPELNYLMPNTLSGLKISGANITSNIGGFNNNIVFIVIAFVIIIGFALRGILLTKPVIKPIYMGGENNTDDASSFRNHLGVSEKSVVGNIYLLRILDEKVLTILGLIVSAALIIIVLLGGLA